MHQRTTRTCSAELKFPAHKAIELGWQARVFLAAKLGAMRFPNFQRVLIVALSLALFSCGCKSPSSSTDPTPPLPGPQPRIESVSYKADPREPKLAEAIAHLLTVQHVHGQKIDDALSKKSFEQFLKMLDPDKLFLLASDVTELRAHETELDDDLLSGRLNVAHLASGIFAKRLKAVEGIVNARLAKDFDFSIDEYRETDSEKLEYAKTDVELAERWRKVLKLEALGRTSRMGSRIEGLEKAIKEHATKDASAFDSPEDAGKALNTLERALAKIPKTEDERLAKALEELKTSYSARFVRLADVDPLTPAANFINSLTSSFDPHTLYLPPTEKENFDISMSNSLEGIGAVLVEQEHFIAVSAIVAGGASWRQGELVAGDVIMSVAQAGEDPVDIGDMKINKVVKMIRGPKGTMVTLTVEKDDGSIKSISIVRDRVEIKESFAKGATLQLPGGPQVGYIELQSFYGDTSGRDRSARFSAEDVQKLLSIYAKRKVGGVILDLRSNGGGLLDDARKMTGYFIEEGPVVQTRLPDGTVEVLEDTDPRVQYEGQVVVLIDRFSASASEIVAAALQDYGRAIIVGPGPTHGKGTVQALLSLNQLNDNPTDPPIGYLKLTVQMFYRINGSSTQRKGVSADINFPDSFKYLETGERNLDNALPWSKVDKLSFRPWTETSWNTADLLSKSTARQAKSDYFVSLDKRAELIKKRDERTKLPLQRKRYDTLIKEQTAEIKALTPDADKMRDFFKVTPVSYASSKDDNSKASKANVKRWSEALAKDAVIAESIQILNDMM